jgi:hypothetical protein
MGVAKSLLNYTDNENAKKELFEGWFIFFLFAGGILPRVQYITSRILVEKVKLK